MDTFLLTIGFDNWRVVWTPLSGVAVCRTFQAKSDQSWSPTPLMLIQKQLKSPKEVVRLNGLVIPLADAVNGGLTLFDNLFHD